MLMLGEMDDDVEELGVYAATLCACPGKGGN